MRTRIESYLKMIFNLAFKDSGVFSSGLRVVKSSVRFSAHLNCKRSKKLKRIKSNVVG